MLCINLCSEVNQQQPAVLETEIRGKPAHRVQGPKAPKVPCTLTLLGDDQRPVTDCVVTSNRAIEKFVQRLRIPKQRSTSQKLLVSEVWHKKMIIDTAANDKSTHLGRLGSCSSGVEILLNKTRSMAGRRSKLSSLSQCHWCCGKVLNEATLQVL